MDRKLRIDSCEPRRMLASFAEIGDFREAVANGDLPTAVGNDFGEYDRGVENANARFTRTHEGNLQELAIAALDHESATQRLPANAIFSADGQPLLSWRVSLLPFLGHSELYDQFNREAAWDSPENLALLDQMPDVFRFPVPSNQLPTGNGPASLGPKTVYQAIVGPDTAVTADTLRFRGLPLSDFPDGLSNTILFARVELDDAVEWTRPVDIEFDASNPLQGLDRVSKAGFEAVTVDASIHRVPRSVDLANLSNLILRNDGQFVDFSEITSFNPVNVNMQRISIANLNYELINRSFVPESIASDAGQPLLSWRVALLPFLSLIHI